MRETLDAGKHCDIALMGIGTVSDPAYSSLYQGGHIALETLEQLRQGGAVGDVGGVHIDIYGNVAGGALTSAWSAFPATIYCAFLPGSLWPAVWPSGSDTGRAAWRVC